MSERKRKHEHQIDVFVPPGETRVSICVFSRNPGELEQIRIQGVSGTLIQQTKCDTVFVIPKRNRRVGNA